MLPDIVDESLIRPFNFYFNGCICQGMAHQDKLYHLTRSFGDRYRADALAFACELSAQGNQTVITISPGIFRVWIDLCSTGSESTSPPNRHLSFKRKNLVG